MKKTVLPKKLILNGMIIILICIAVFSIFYLDVFIQKGEKDNIEPSFYKENNNSSWKLENMGHTVQNSIAMSDSGKLLVASGVDGLLSYIDNKGNLIWKYDNTSPINCVAISTDGKTAVSGSKNGIVVCYDEEGNLLWNHFSRDIEKIQNMDPIKSIAISSDGNYIIAGTEGYYSGFPNLLLFSKNGSLLWRKIIGKPSRYIPRVDLSSDGYYIAVGNDYNKIQYFYRNGTEILDYTTYGPIDSAYYGRYKNVSPGNYIALSDDGSYLAAGSLDCYVYLFSNNGTRLWRYKGERPFCVTDITSDGSYIVSASDDGTVFFFNQAGDLLRDYKTGSIIRSLEMDSTGSLIVAGTSNSELYCFNRSGELTGVYDTDGGVSDVAVSKDGEYIAAVTENGVLYFFERDDLIGITAGNDPVIL